MVGRRTRPGTWARTHMMSECGGPGWLTDREQKSCDIPLPAKGVFPAWASTVCQETSPYAEKPKGRSKHDN
jgi:hypothetical protein